MANQHTQKYNESDREKVLDLFLNTKDNSVPIISKKTGFKRSFINTTIDRYFKEKMENKD